MLLKRCLRWGIVLFLLAVLPVMTVALAQEQEPAGKAPLPAVMEPGESAPLITWNKYESEANNTLATADVMDMADVMGGKIGSTGDVDYFKFNFNDPGGYYGYALVDIEANSIGSPLNSTVCLLDESGAEIACNDDTDTPDSLVFRTLWPYKHVYYIRVADASGRGGNNYNYRLVLSSPLLVSAGVINLGTGYVAGIPFRSEDILAHSDLNTDEEKWVLFFDGSDVGVTKNLWNIGCCFYFGFAVNMNIPGVGLVTPRDIVEFTPTKYGPATEGTFAPYYYFKGSEYGITTSGERIDALHSYINYYSQTAECHGNPVSTVGVAVANSNPVMKVQDEDIFCLNEIASPFWLDYFFDGSKVGGLAIEDVYALSIKDGEDSETVYMTILGSGKIAGHRVMQKDIFAINFPAYSWGGVIWHGPDHGWNYNIDAFEYYGQ